MSEIRKITLQFPSLRAFLAEYGERISAAGMLLRSAAPPAVGSKVEIEVVVAEGMRLLRARGKTLWSEKGAPGRQNAAAVRFEELDPASRTLIGKIVEQRRRDGAELFDLEDVPGPREARVRDLTRPARGAVADDAIFDLASPPDPGGADLFAAGAEPPAVAEAPAEAAGERRVPVAPVPLLADAGAAPFDLETAPEADEGAAADLDLGPAPARDANLEPGARADLGDLFGGDEPSEAPSRGRTEAFPPSFVDEVEAELEAADAPQAGYLELDTGELELRLGSSLEDLQPEAPFDVLPTAEPPPEPQAAESEAAAPAPPLEPKPEPKSERAVAAVQLDAEPEKPAASAGPAPPSTDLDPPQPVLAVPEAEAVAPDLPPPPKAAEASAPPESVGAMPTVAPSSESEPEPEPEAEGETATEAEPEVDPAAGAEGDSQGEGGEEPETPAEAATAAPLSASIKVAEAFDAVRGAETVEIPIVEPGSSPAPAATPPAPAAATGPPPVEDSPLVGPPPAAPPPGAPPPAMDDNLLSIPEFRQEPPAPATADEPAAVEELPSSAESLRGAASRSRHLGTWLLIALLIAALGVAGYFLMGMIRDEVRPAPADPPAAVADTPTSPRPAAPADAAGGGETAAEDPAPAVSQAPEQPEASGPAVGQEAEQPEASVPAAAAPRPAPVEPAAPAAPLTGLNRITWTEYEEETVLALVGDGEFPGEQIELVPITGEQPRLVIKIPGVERAFQPAVLEVGTAQVQRVRTGLQAGGGLHVVVDLAAPGVVVRQRSSRGSRMEVRLGAQ